MESLQAETDRALTNSPRLFCSRSQLVDGLGFGSDERLSVFANDDDRDATKVSVGVLEDALNTSGHGCPRAKTALRQAAKESRNSAFRFSEVSHLRKLPVQ
jgi:hypothetical protein